MDRSSRSDSANSSSNASPVNWAKDFAASFIDSAVLKPVDGAAQLLHLPQAPLLEVTGRSATGAAKQSVASEIGSAVGMVVPFLAISKGVDFAMGGSLAAAAAESAVGAKSLALNGVVGRAALTGAIYGGIFTPTSGGSLKDRLTNSLVDGGTFAVFSGAAQALGKAPGLSSLRSQGTAGVLKDVAANSLAGLPAGLFSAESSSLLYNGHLASFKDAGSAAAQFAIFGGALAGVSRALGSVKAARAQRSTVPEAGSHAMPAVEPAIHAQTDLSSAEATLAAPAGPELAQRRQFELGDNGLIERGPTGKILQATGMEGTYNYEWSGDQLVRASTPQHAVYDRIDDTHWQITHTHLDEPPAVYNMSLSLDNSTGTLTRELLDRGETTRYHLNGDWTYQSPIQDESKVASTVYHFDGSRTNNFKDGTSEHLTRAQVVGTDAANHVLNEGLFASIQNNPAVSELTGKVAGDSGLRKDGTVYLFDKQGAVMNDATGDPLVLPASVFAEGGSGIADDTMQQLYHDRSEIAGAVVVGNVLDGAGRVIPADAGPDSHARAVQAVVGEVPADLSTGTSHQQLLSSLPGNVLEQMTNHADALRRVQEDSPTAQALRSRPVTPIREEAPGGGMILRDPLSGNIVSTRDNSGFNTSYVWNGGKLTQIAMDGGGQYTRLGDNLWTAESPDGFSEKVSGDFSLDRRDGALIETRNYFSGQKQVQTRYGLDGNSQQLEFTKDGVQVNSLTS